jgi:hypothetical protein
VDVVQVRRQADARGFPPIAERKFARRRRQSIGDGVRGTLVEHAPNHVLEETGVHPLMLEHQHEIHEISTASRAAPFVRAREGMQLLRNLALQRNEKHLDGVEADCRQESRPPGALRIPWIGDADTDVDLKRLEWASDKGTLHSVSHGEADTRFAEFFAAGDGKVEVIAGIFDCRSLKIGTGSFDAVRVIRIQID